MAVQMDFMGGHDYYPGPLPLNPAEAIDTEVANRYNRIFKMSRQRVQDFLAAVNAGRSVAEYTDILEWPTSAGSAYGPQAPFVDLNGNGVYEPRLGEYPEMLGDHMAWWVINDRAAPHSVSGAAPIGVEVQLRAFYFEVADSSSPHFGRLYFRVNCFNRSDTDYPVFQTGLFSDIDAGFFNSNFLGSDSVLQFAYGYSVGTGFRLPTAVGYLPLRAALSGSTSHPPALSGMISFYNDQSVIGIPREIDHYWNYLTGFWKDGSPLVDDRTGNGNGYMDLGETDVRPIRYPYPDPPFMERSTSDPLRYWSEVHTGNTPFDRKACLNFSSTDFPAGSVYQLDIAVLWAFCPVDSSGAYTHVRNLLRRAKDTKDEYAATYRAYRPTKRVDPNSRHLAFYPNPTTDFVYFASLPAGHWEVAVYDASGRRLQQFHQRLYHDQLLAVDLKPMRTGVYAVELRGPEGLHQFVRVMKH